MSEKRCYTVQELQEILGVSRPTIYNLLKKKEFRWIQLDGGKYRMINKWADKGKFIVIKVGSRVRIRPIIGDAKLSEIITRFIERYYQSLLKRRAVINPLNKTSRNEFVSSSTVRDVNKLLRNCFEQAVKWELMEKNPCTHATVPKHKSQLLPMKSIRNFWQKCW